MLNIKILPLESSDIEEVLKIENECFSEPWSENSFKNSIKSGSNYFICAKFDSKIVGYSGMYWVLDEGYIYNLAVDKNFRRWGIASNLILNLFNHSKNINLKLLSLEVRESNKAAKSLYRKLGFEFVGVRKNFYSFPTENAIIMTHYF